MRQKVNVLTFVFKSVQVFFHHQNKIGSGFVDSSRVVSLDERRERRRNLSLLYIYVANTGKKDIYLRQHSLSSNKEI